MAPEQIKSKDVGPACDIYALGVVLVRTADRSAADYGIRYTAETMQARAQRRGAASAHRLRPDLPHDVSAICSSLP